MIHIIATTKVRSIELAVILAMMSVSTYITAVILYAFFCVYKKYLQLKRFRQFELSFSPNSVIYLITFWVSDWVIDCCLALRWQLFSHTIQWLRYSAELMMIVCLVPDKNAYLDLHRRKMLEWMQDQTEINDKECSPVFNVDVVKSKSHSYQNV